MMKRAGGTAIACRSHMVKRQILTIAAVFALGLPTAAPAAVADSKEAKVAREKPLQRCDQLADKAQLDCLAKARERVLEARKKREEKPAQVK